MVLVCCLWCVVWRCLLSLLFLCGCVVIVCDMWDECVFWLRLIVWWCMVCVLLLRAVVCVRVCALEECRCVLFVSCCVTLYKLVLLWRLCVCVLLLLFKNCVCCVWLFVCCCLVCVVCLWCDVFSVFCFNRYMCLVVISCAGVWLLCFACLLLSSPPCLCVVIRCLCVLCGLLCDVVCPCLCICLCLLCLWVLFVMYDVIFSGVCFVLL